MSQNISVIVTKQTNITIPDDIPHIIKNNQLLIAIDTNDHSFGLDQIMQQVTTTGNTELLAYITDYDFISLAHKLKISSFAVYHYSDWADIPFEIQEFTVVDNIIITDSFFDMDAKEPNDKYEDNSAEKLLNIITDDALDYRTYSSFVADYEYNKYTTYFLVKTIVDGVIPGDFSLVAFGAVVVRAGLNETFYAELKPISEYSERHWPEKHHYSRKNRISFNEPEKVMRDFAMWVSKTTKGKAIFLSDNIGTDLMFINWYLRHFRAPLHPFSKNYGYVVDYEDLSSFYQGLTANGTDLLEIFEKLDNENDDPLKIAIKHADLFLKLAKKYNITFD